MSITGRINMNRSPICFECNCPLKCADIIDYDYSSGEFSTWTESSWAIDAMDVRFFLIPSKKFEIATLVAGVLILITSLIGGWFFSKQASILFSSNSPEANGPVSL